MSFLDTVRLYQLRTVSTRNYFNAIHILHCTTPIIMENFNLKENRAFNLNLVFQPGDMLSVLSRGAKVFIVLLSPDNCF